MSERERLEGDEPRLLIKKINRLAEELGEEVLRQGLSLTSPEPILFQARDKGLVEEVVTEIARRLAEIAQLKLRLAAVPREAATKCAASSGGTVPCPSPCGEAIKTGARVTRAPAMRQNVPLEKAKSARPTAETTAIEIQ